MLNTKCTIEIPDLLDTISMRIAKREADIFDRMFKRNIPKWKIDLILKFPFLKNLRPFKYEILKCYGLGKNVGMLVHNKKILDQEYLV